MGSPFRKQRPFPARTVSLSKIPTAIASRLSIGCGLTIRKPTALETKLGAEEDALKPQISHGALRASNIPPLFKLVTHRVGRIPATKRRPGHAELHAQHRHGLRFANGRRPPDRSSIPAKGQGLVESLANCADRDRSVDSREDQCDGHS